MISVVEEVDFFLKNPFPTEDRVSQTLRWKNRWHLSAGLGNGKVEILKSQRNEEPSNG